MRRKSVARPKPAIEQRDSPFRQMDAEMALAQRVGNWEAIFCGLTTTEIRKARLREAIGSRKADFSEPFERTFGEPL